MTRAAASYGTGVDLLLTWVGALREGDLVAIASLLAGDVVWQGIEPDLVCVGRAQVLDALREQTPVRFEVTALELWSAHGHAVLGTRSEHLPQPSGGGLDGQIYNVFERRGDRFGRIQDFAGRSDAFKAAGLDETATWR